MGRFLRKTIHWPADILTYWQNQFDGTLSTLRRGCNEENNSRKRKREMKPKQENNEMDG